jgi:hypothetical protein
MASASPVAMSHLLLTDKWKKKIVEKMLMVFISKDRKLILQS